MERETEQSTSAPAVGRGNGAVTGQGDPVVSVRGLTKTFRRGDGSTLNAVDAMDLDINAGEMLVLLGPSGCGKTTLLRSIAGLEEPDAGSVEVAGRTMFDSARRTWVPPERRGIGMMFQTYALWPHKTALGNVAYPMLGRKGRGKAKAEARAKELLELVGVPELVGQYPGQMSGGQQQRVALARALAAGDQLILFDEPLSNVDAQVREHLRFELLSMQREIGFTGVYVTHDQGEAMALATRLAVLSQGRIIQCASPREVYERPATAYVADFLGDGNRLPATVGEGGIVETPVGPMRLDASADVTPGQVVDVMTRPQHWKLSRTQPSSVNRVLGTVRRTVFLGSHVEVIVEVADATLTVHHVEEQLIIEGEQVWLSIEPQYLWTLEPA